MRIPSARLLPLLLVLSLTTVLPASADPSDPCADEAGQIVYTEEQVWVHEGDTKVGNGTQHLGHAPAPWDTTEPTASVTTGAGAGAVSAAGSTESLAPGGSQKAIMAGTVEGCIDRLLVDLYAFHPTNRTGTSGSLAEAPLNYGFQITIDGETWDLGGPLEAVTTANPNGQATYRNRMAFNGIRTAMERRGLDLTGEHEVEVTVTAWFANTNNVVFVWDTTEVPTSLTFNGVGDTSYGVPVAIR